MSCLLLCQSQPGPAVILLTLTANSPHAAKICQTAKNTLKHPPHLGGKDGALLPEEKKLKCGSENSAGAQSEEGLGELDSAAG